MPIKVAVVVLSRANYARIKTVLEAIRAHPDLELQLIVGASMLLYRAGKAIDVVIDDGFMPEGMVHNVIEGNAPIAMAKSTGLGLLEISSLLSTLSPSFVLSVADRFETLSTAIAASYMNIPLVHIQGGELTGSIDESVRHTITKLAHVHCVSNDHAAKVVRQMGEDPDSIFVTGCPSIDLAHRQKNGLIPADVLHSHGSGYSINIEQPYLVVSQHPVTTEWTNAMDQIQATWKAVEMIGMQAIWLWPNIDAGSDAISKQLRLYKDNPRHKVRFFRNFHPDDYIRLIDNCSCLIGNSSSAIREGSYLGVPAVNIGSRQANRLRANNVIDCDYDYNQIFEAIVDRLECETIVPSQLYGQGDAGQKIADLLTQIKPTIQKRFYELPNL